MPDANERDLPMLNAIDGAHATLVPPQSRSSLDLLPELDYLPMRRPEWTVTRSAEGVTIMQKGRVITIVPTELPALLAALYRLGA